jgi:serine/threonine-protein kinase RsbW
MSSGANVRLDFRSAFDILDCVQAVSDYVGRMAGLDEESLHWFGVAVRESVINAIKHGNANDDRKRVYIEFTALESETAPGIDVRVRDEGPGFDPATIPSPLAPENLLKAQGRGIFLIRSLMDEVVMQQAPQGGMEVRMVKRVHTKIGCHPDGPIPFS